MRIRESSARDAWAIARVQVNTWRHAYRDIIAPSYLAMLSVSQHEMEWQRVLAGGDDDEFVLVAERDTGEVIGFAHAGPELLGDPEYRGEIYRLYVLPSEQQRGAGRALMDGVAKRLSATGIRSMLLWALGANRAGCRFYEKLGGDVVHRRTIQIGGMDYEDVAYGWLDTDALGGTAKFRQSENWQESFDAPELSR